MTFPFLHCLSAFVMMVIFTIVAKATGATPFHAAFLVSAMWFMREMRDAENYAKLKPEEAYKMLAFWTWHKKSLLDWVSPSILAWIIALIIF